MNTTAERFLRYAKMHTTSKEDTGLCPSSDEQFALAKLLVRELIDMGIQNAEVDEHCYVYASLPASEGLAHLPALGFVSETYEAKLLRAVCQVEPERVFSLRSLQKSKGCFIA